MRASEFINLPTENLDEAFIRSPHHYTDMAYKLGSEQKLSYLGKGARGTVYTHPTQDTTVVKVFGNDRGYAEWLRWSASHQANKYVPKVIPHPDGSFIKLYKYFKKGTRTVSQRIGIVHLERLNEITNDDLYRFSKQIVSYLDPEGYTRIEKQFLKIPYLSYFELLTDARDWHVISLNAETKGDSDLADVADFFSRQEYGFKTTLDLHLKNIMKRDNGQIVFVDPLA